MSQVGGGSPVTRIGEYGNLFRLIGADLNSVADQAFTKAFVFNQYRIREIWMVNASASQATTLKTIAIRTATGGGGTALVNAQNITALVLPENMLSCTILNSDLRNTATLYARLSAGTGVAGTADIYIDGMALT